MENKKLDSQYIESLEYIRCNSHLIQSTLKDYSHQITSLQSSLKPIVEATSIIKDIARTIKLYSSNIDVLKGISSIYLEISKTIPPVVEWFRSFNFSQLLAPLLDIDSRHIDELHTIYLMAMYECKWFPYAGLIADYTLFETVDEIIATSRGISKRREKRIDNAILAYYTDKKVKILRSNWQKLDLDYCLKKSLRQSIDAYFRGEYVLTISCLTTMWEGLIYIKAHNALPEERQRQKMSITKQELSELTMANDYDLIISDYFNNFIVSQCNNVTEVVEGVPNRHGTSHSWYKKYPNKKAALNAILLTDFIINLKPITVSKNESN
ncbi:MAG: hypothetical protein J1E81_04695 [Eubacterium sp.]|nr:hypothetical protein [Eubacterium sp.]